MPAHQVVLQISPRFLHPEALSSRQHRAPISPLSATLMNTPATVANKRLTENLTPLDATLTKNPGVGRTPCSKPANLPTCKLASDLCPNSFPLTFLATPHQLTPLLSHSYKNHRGVGVENIPSPALGSLFALLDQRVFHNSFAIRYFHTLSKNSRVAYPPLLKFRYKTNRVVVRQSPTAEFAR